MDNYNQLQQAVQSGKYLILDTETTGFEPAEIIQLSIIDQDGATAYTGFFNPRTPITDGAYRTHNISKDSLRFAPSWSQEVELIRSILAGQNVIIYNSVFDLKALKQTSEVARVAQTPWKAVPTFICAMLAYSEYRQVVDPNPKRGGKLKWFKLGDACHDEGVEARDAHSSLGDCLATLNLVKAICHK